MYKAIIFGSLLPMMLLLACEKEPLDRNNPLDNSTSNGNGQAGFPTITDGTLNDLYSGGVRFEGRVVSDGGTSVLERGVCYNLSGNPSVSYYRITAGTGTGPYNCPVNGLLPGYTYYFRAFARNTTGIAYGNILSVTVPIN